MSNHPTASSTTTRRSYPPPDHPLDRTLRVPPPPILPYRPPPGPSPPPLPCRAALPLQPPAGWTVTHHAVPAAYPRRFADSFGSLIRESAPQTLEDSSDTRAEGKEKKKERSREESKEERRARNEGEAREMLRLRYDSAEYPNLATDRGAGTGTGQSSGDGEKHKGLWMAAERWTRSDSDSDSASAGGQGEGERGGGETEAEIERVTLVVTHANGLHKEMWYPTLHRLLAHPLSTSTTFGAHRKNERQTEYSTPTPAPPNLHAPVPVPVPVQIDEIWLFDDIHHGASLDLNAGRIGPVHGWSDGGRDVVNFLAHVWKGEGGAGGVYPEQALDWREQRGQTKVKAEETERPTSKRRKVIGVGHSFGGNALVQAAAERPDLFHALFLVDPMCPAHAPPRSSLNILEGSVSKYWPLVMGAIKRRSHWPSLEAARALRRAPFFGAWDEEVWEIFLSHGLVPGPDERPSSSLGDKELDSDGQGQSQSQGQGHSQGQGVQLATPGWAEAAVFGEPTGLCEGWQRLLDIPAKVAVGFLMANEPKATFGEKMTREMVWRAPGSVNEIVPDAGHLAVQERPDRVADALGRFLGMVVGGDAGMGPRAKL